MTPVRTVIAFAVWLPMSFVGCRQEPREQGVPVSTAGAPIREAAPTGATGAPSAPALPAPTDATGWVGQWLGPPCGARPYSRVIELAKGGAVNGEDLVSPCPPDTPCAWSGIIPFGGTWKLDGQRVTLDLRESHDPGPGAQPLALPSELIWDGGPIANEAGSRCAYRPRPRP